MCGLIFFFCYVAIVGDFQCQAYPVGQLVFARSTASCLQQR
jgi:hypothetical protein